jgi:hypothetical protein
MQQFLNTYYSRFASLTWILLLSAGHAVQSRAEIVAELFNPEFLVGDCNYHSLTPASNGQLYFTVGTHHSHTSARLYVFDPQTEIIRELLQLNPALSEDPDHMIPHGKVHTPLIEHKGYLYFTTHTSGYVGSLPDLDPEDGRLPYPGGCFVRFNLATETLERLAQIPLPSEGLITFTMDVQHERLYALTWPSGILFEYNLQTEQLHAWGATQGRGEWGQLGEDWNFICRQLAITPDGQLFGSTDTGQIWEFAADQQRPIRILSGLNLDTVPNVSEVDFKMAAEAHYFWRNWRTILWNPETESFWGLHGGSTQLFEFDPENDLLRSITNLRVPGSGEGRRNPYRTQLGMALGQENVIYYLAHGPALKREGRKEPKANVYLIEYGIDSQTTINHGPIIGPNDERVFFTESLTVGADGHLYSVAWVEVLDEGRAIQIQQARGDALPAETKDVIYEMQLIRFSVPRDSIIP